MKRYISFLITMIIACGAYGATDNEICRRGTLTMLVLQKDVNGSITTNDADEMRWAVDYGYDILAGTGEYVTEITGSATCNDISVKSAVNGSSNNAGAAAPGDANTFLRAVFTDVGTNCWCKMDGPITSWWVYVRAYDDADACASGCTSYCANGMAQNTEMSNGRPMRTAVFDAIW